MESVFTKPEGCKRGVPEPIILPKNKLHKPDDGPTFFTLGGSTGESGSLPIPLPLHSRIIHPAERSQSDTNTIAAFDLQLLQSNREVLEVLNDLRKAHQDADIVLLNEPDGLEQDNLVQRLTISETGVYQTTPGRLFNNPSPLILVLDIREMSADEIATFNDLLAPENPSLYLQQNKGKHPLGRHVKIRLLADRKQLTEMDSDSLNGPSADLWRRVNRIDNTLIAERPKNGHRPMDVGRQQLLPNYPSRNTDTDTDTGMDTDATLPVTIDLHLHRDWRRVLFGGPGIDGEGQVRHIPGQLEQLQPGQTVILKGGNWDDLGFYQQISSLVDKGEYQCNGQRCALPEAIQFYQAEVDDDELAELYTETVDPVTSPPKQPIVVNEVTLLQWLNPIKINELGCSVPNTTLQEQIAQGGTVTITSPLGESLWFLLLNQLRMIADQTGKRPQLFLTNPEQQPEQLELPEDSVNIERPWEYEESAVQVVCYKNTRQVMDLLQTEGGQPLVIQITEQTRLGQLLDNLHIQSERPPRFGRKSTQLQRALPQGQEVIILGLERNPALQQALESVNGPKPSVLINGVLQHYPGAKIRLFWPQGQPCAAPLWQAAIRSAEVLAETDIWHSAACRYGLEDHELPQQALGQLYKLFDQIPLHLTQPMGKLPPLTRDLLDNLIHAARHSQRADFATTLAPKHWRKAINSVLTHYTRQTPAVRDFMKVACEQLLPDGQRDWVDPERLADILGAIKTIDRATIRQHFWSLARAFGPGALETVALCFNDPDQGGNQGTETLHALLACHAPVALRETITVQLQPDPTLTCRYQQLHQRCSRHRKRLEDALASGWRINRDNLPHGHQDIIELADECYALCTNPALSECQRREQIETRLEQALIWPGVDAPWQALVDDLVHGRINQADRELRRLGRLHQRLADAPVVFIEGGTATGKSYSAAQVAERAGPAFITAVGPSTDDRELVQSWVWREQTGSAGRSMQQIDQILLRWAKYDPGTGDHYITLVLNEANLAEPGVLASLQGLWHQPPFIFVDGQPFPVSHRHRVILTGNPASYAGRHLDPDLLAKVQRIYYPPQDHGFLHDRVVVPTLRDHLAPYLPGPERDRVLTDTATALLELWQHYRALLPDHEFTPRDLTDICAWLGWYLHQLALPAGQITQAHIHALLWHSVKDVLGAETGAHQADAIVALEIWFSVHYPMDQSLLSGARDAIVLPAWEHFKATTAQLRSDFDSSSSAVSTLVEALCQDLLRCQQAHSSGNSHGGRQATIIEGPTGRGKDMTLQLAIESIRRQVMQRRQTMPGVTFINAGDCPWETLRHHIQEAQQTGEILVISELNLIDSQHLEGELNAILEGKAAPGFHLFATTNPPDYGGRKPLSPALKGRFRHLPIRQYSQSELTCIAEKVLPATEQGRACAAQMADLHCRLRDLAQKQGRSLQPVSQDLQNLAHALVAQGGGPKAIPSLFDRHYRLYLLAVGKTVNQLPSIAAPGGSATHCDRTLSQWLHQTVPTLQHPWLVKRGNSCALNPKTHQITVPNNLDQQAAKVAVIKELAQARWCQLGFPLSAPGPMDALKQAVYRCWQQRWFDTVYQGVAIKGEQIFPMDALQRTTLAMESNRLCHAKLAQFLETVDFTAELQWPAYWQRLVNILTQPTYRACEQEQNIEAGTSAREGGALLPQSTTPLAMCTTAGHRRRLLPTLNHVEIFQNIRPTMVRQAIWDVGTTAQGELTWIPTAIAQSGLETVSPAILSAQKPIPLGNNHHYGLITLSIDKAGDGNRWWQPLASVTPADTVVAVRTEPETPFNMIKDRYTGLHLIDLPEAQSDQDIVVHYVVESQIDSPFHALHQHTRASTEQWPARQQPAVTCPATIQQELEQLFSDQYLSSLPKKQRLALQAIRKATSPEERIEHIRQYCRDFQETSAPTYHDRVALLLCAREGGCRERTTVFVALCYYFQIPARVVTNEIHAFAEYSLDHGQTWLSACLSGVQGHPRRYITPNFQKTTEGVSIGTDPKTLETLKNLNAEQADALAETLGLNQEELYSSLVSGALLPARTGVTLNGTELIRGLWDRCDNQAFLLANTLLKSEGILSPHQGSLLASSQYESPLADAALGFLWGTQSPDILSRELQQLHTRLVDTGLRAQSSWQHAIMTMLRKMNLNLGKLSCSGVMDIARMALEQGWLKPGEGPLGGIMSLHNLLQKLNQNADDRIKPLFKRSLQQWYDHYLGQSVNLQGVVGIILQESQASEFPQQCAGHSATLETLLKTNGLKQAWTDRPEGLPNVERMLTARPAFCRQNPIKNGVRPTILLGCPEWSQTNLDDKADQLCQQYCANHPDDGVLFEKYERYHHWQRLKEKRRKQIRGQYYHWQSEQDYREEDKQQLALLDQRYNALIAMDNCEISPAQQKRVESIRTKYADAVKAAFAHYLYQTTHGAGGGLVVCWVSAIVKRPYYMRSYGYTVATYPDQYGHHIPQSPAELMGLMLKVDSFQGALERLDGAYLRKALKYRNALILKGEDLTNAASELIDTVEIDAGSVSVP